jgi:hypothetical protein
MSLGAISTARPEARRTIDTCRLRAEVRKGANNMKARALALIGALLAIALSASAALAVAPPGKVTVETAGCTFTVLIDLEQHYDVVGWKVKEFNAANWNDGLTLFKGSGPTDQNGDMTVGPFTAPAGHYNVAVDDEYPPDGSSIVVDFTLSCAAATPTPTGSELPTEQPSGSALPTEQPSGSALPTGGELPIQGTPPAGGVAGLTPPPTDAAAGVPTARDDGLVLIVLASAGLAGAALFLARRARAAMR